jgi:predicted ABC-type ATPase
MVAFPLAPFLMRAGITALGAGAAGEGIKSLQNINPDVAEQAFLRTIIGPISDIFNRTTDTPSGKVFAPTGEVIEPNQIPGISPPEQQQGITGLPIPEQQQGITGLPIPEKAPGLPGLINPEQVDTSILNKEETPEVTTADFEKEIKIIKSPDTPDTYDVMYDDKIIKQLYKKRTKFEGQNEYVVIEPSDGSYDDTFIGLKNSKERVKQNVARQILDDSKQKEKEYLDKLINTIENKDYENFEKIKNHDFENFNLRSKEFKDTLIKYIPKQVDLYRNNAILEQEAIKETLNRTSNPSGSLIDKPAQIELPDKAALKEESKLGDELFKLSETGTVQDYETFKNNPIIKKKIALSKQLYKDTTANPGYGTAEYWADRPFTKGVNGYKELVKKVYDRKKIKNNKEFYIVMGPSSAGKSTGLVDKLQKETGSFLADSDEIKKLIPEFNNGYNANGVHKESSDINSRILAMAMKAGDNVIYPTTGREAGKLKGIIDNAEKKGYKVYVDLVTADRSVLLLRNLARMLKTNRVVDGDKLLTEEVINGILETYKNLDEKYKRGKPIDTTPKR